MGPAAQVLSPERAPGTSAHRFVPERRSGFPLAHCFVPVVTKVPCRSVALALGVLGSLWSLLMSCSVPSARESVDC